MSGTDTALCDGACAVAPAPAAVAADAGTAASTATAPIAAGITNARSGMRDIHPPSEVRYSVTERIPALDTVSRSERKNGNCTGTAVLLKLRCTRPGRVLACGREEGPPVPHGRAALRQVSTRPWAARR